MHSISRNARGKILRLALLILTSLAALAGTVAGGAETSATDAASADGASRPEITTMTLEGDIAVVTVTVPEGCVRVVLEGCQRQDWRGWVPLAVRRLDGRAGVTTFRVPARSGHEIFRVRSDATDPLPAAYYRGSTNVMPNLLPYDVVPTLGSGLGVVRWGSEVPIMTFDGNVMAPPGVVPGPESKPVDAGREVVESDIWQLRGSRLYFFNAMRGLQVIDVSNPDAPVLSGTLPLPAAGEQMYVPDEGHVVLLVRQACDAGVAGHGAVVVVDVADAARPRVVSRFDVPGQLAESRMVGTALYLASIAYEPSANDPAVWETATVISAFDLADPSAPVARPTRRLVGNTSAIAAEDGRLFVALNDFGQGWPGTTILHVFDISSPDGTVGDAKTFRLQGRVADKFKLDLDGEVLRVVLETQMDGKPAVPVTRLVTLDLSPSAADGDGPLGSLDLAPGESVFATRFDGPRGYVVTYRRIDPLWVLDLSDPRRPRVTGELHIPGWSTYLRPMGDRLLAVGIDDVEGRRPAVQLFDVADPANPALLSKVIVGESWASSEATIDEKALGVFPSEGLVLLPFQNHGMTGTSQGLQLIDLGRDDLKRRGVIAHPEWAPRRAAVKGDRVLSLSSKELLTVNVADRDRPVVTADLGLSRSVDRVVVVDRYLVRFSGQGLEVGDVERPEAVLGKAPLGDLPVLGATAKGSRVYVLQGTPAQVSWLVPPGGQDWTTTTNAGRMRLAVFDASKLPELTLRGEVVSEHFETGLNATAEALWPTEETLVWSIRGGYGGYWGGGIVFRGGPVPIDVPGVAGQVVFRTDAGVVDGTSFVAAPTFGGGMIRFMPVDGWFWPPWGLQGSLLAAYDVREAARPEFRSLRRGSTAATGSSRAVAHDGLVQYTEESQESEIAGTNHVVTMEVEWVVVTNVVTRTNVVKVPHPRSVTNLVEVAASYPAVMSPERSRDPGSVRIAAGATHNLRRDDVGTVWTWGDTASRREPDGSYRDSAVPEPVPFPAGLEVKALAAGSRWNLAVDEGGLVWSWVAHEDLGTPPIPGEEPAHPPEPWGPPVIVEGLPPATAVSVGHLHAVAVAGGQVWAWGDNLHGQLASLTARRSTVPLPVTFPEGNGSSFVSVAAGAYHSYALNGEGQVFAWGANEFGQLGTADDSAGTIPVMMLKGARAIAAGAFHGVALGIDGTVWTWGRSREGQLGRETTGAEPWPMPVPGLPPIRAIAAGGFHTLALAEDGRLWLWGMMDPESDPGSVPPIPLSVDEPVIEIAAGRRHALLVTAGGRSIAWGRGGEGQLGQGPMGMMAVRGVVPRVETVVEYTIETNVMTVSMIEKVAVERPVTNAVPIVRWWQRHELATLDYSADAADPAVRPARAFPGALAGFSHGGAMLYAIDRRTDPTVEAHTREFLVAVADDGVSLFVGDSWELADLGFGQSSAVAVLTDGRVLVARGSGATAGANRLELLTLDAEARFEPRSERPLEGLPGAISVLADWVVVQGGAGAERFDLSGEGAFEPRTIGVLSLGCLGYDLGLASGNRTAGLWVPSGEYGVIRLAPE